MRTFNHNGGIYTRPDIPSATPQPWKCFVCKKDIDSQVEQYQHDKVRFIPASRYWHGYIVGIEFCSAECSHIYSETK